MATIFGGSKMVSVRAQWTLEWGNLIVVKAGLKDYFL